MAEYLIQGETLSNIAAAIREKTGGTANIYPGNMAGQIRSITSGAIDTAGIDQGVIDEANRVASSINNKKTANSITFIAMSDMHEMGDGENSDQAILEAYRLANTHAGQGAELIARQVNPDFFVNLGDLAWGIQSYTVHDMAQSITNARVKTGSLERLTKCFATPGNHDIGYRAGSFDENLVKAMIGNYQYMDFAAKKIRVIVANTSDISDGTDRVEGVSGEQLQWFAEALDLSGKSDAAKWGILIFSHHPLDWNANTMPLANCVASYVNGGTYGVTHDGITISKSYSGKNSAKIIGTFHGHVHCYKVADLSTTTADNPVKRIAIPNACNGRNNEYGKEGNLTFGEPAADTCPSGNSRKSTVAGQDTAFCVVTIDLDDAIIYADCFGSLGDTAPGSHAGYDRTISYGMEEVVMYTITNLLSGVENGNGMTTVKEGAAYTAEISMPVGCALDVFTVTMAGVDITSTAVSGLTIHIPKVTGNIVITIVSIPIEDFVYGVFTNQVSISEERDSTAVYNGIGYRENTYPSETNDGTATGIVCTGWIPFSWSPDNVLYIKGATLDTGNDHVRIFGFNGKTSVNGSVGYTRGAFISERFTVETLGDKYYRLTPKSTASAVTHIRVSLVGTGERLIVTVNEQIHAEGSMGNYSVTQNLDAQISTGNNTNVAMAGSTWTTTLSAAAGYEIDSIVVTMGGADITASAVSGNVITVSHVSGNIVVTATARSSASYHVTNLVPLSQEQGSTAIFNGIGYQNGKYLSSSGGESDDAAIVATGYIPYAWNSGNMIYIRGAQVTTTSHVRIYGYVDKAVTPSSSAMCTGSNLSTYFTVEELEAGTYYKLTPKGNIGVVTHLRLSLVGTGEELIVTVNEAIV